jgi:hypothetical protein
MIRLGLDREKVFSPLIWIEISNKRFWELSVVSFKIVNPK